MSNSHERNIQSPLSEELIAEARNHPDGWVYVIEGNFGPDDAVPPHKIKGAWKVDAKGEIVGDFISNPNYREGMD